MPEQGQQEFRMVELARRLANVVRPGVVAEVDAAIGAVKVRYAEDSDAVTDWLPVVAQRAGGDASWWFPEPQEQVVVLAPSGELHNGIVLGSLYSEAHPAPASDPDKHLARYSDGAVIEYDRANHLLRAVLPAGGAAEIEAPEGVTITGDLMVTGDVTIEGEVETTGDIHTDGNLDSDGQVEDLNGSMAEMRRTYNAHMHPSGMPSTGPPAQKMT